MKKDLQAQLAKVQEALALKPLNEYELDALTKLKKSLEYAIEVLRD